MATCRLDSDLLPSKFEPEWRDEFLLEQLPVIPVQNVAKFAIVVHLSPTITAPLASGHINEKVPAFLVVVDLLVDTVLLACVRWERVDLALLNERSVWSDPWLHSVQVLHRILLLMLPLHMLLLIADWVPPDVEKTIGPCTALDEKRAEVEATTILRNDHIDGGRLSIANWRQLFCVKVWLGEWVGDI